MDRLADALRRAMGDQLRLCREARCWSRADMVARMPTKVEVRSLLAYEHGARSMTTTRWVELAMTLGFSPGVIMDRALQAAGQVLQNVVLRVDLTMVLTTRDPVLEPLVGWARNRLASARNGMVDLHPVAVRELAAAFGYDPADLARRLARLNTSAGPDTESGTPS